MNWHPAGDRLPDDRAQPPGTTLMELLVTLAILGVLAGVVGLAWLDHGFGTALDAPAGAAKAVSIARRGAVAQGGAVTIVVEVAGAQRTITALPDGRVLGAVMLGFDPLSGRQSDTVDLGGSRGGRQP